MSDRESGKLRIAVLFGGRSVEHEVSIISALQAVQNMDTDKYIITPLYMTKDASMYVGEDIGKIESYKDIPALLARSTRVIFVHEADGVYLTPYPAKKGGLFGKKDAYSDPIPVDLVFPVVHGTNVEDGTLQGYLKTIGVPFAGCDVTPSCLGMDKYASKVILKENGVPVLDGFVYTLSDYADMEKLLDSIEKSVGYPVIIKPYDLGSSVGISVAKDRDALVESVNDAFRYARRIIAEHAITKLREINCAVLGDDTSAEASECEEPFHTADILSYADKYEGNGGTKGAKGGSTGSQGGAKSGSMATSVQRKLPADLSPEQREEVRSMAVKAFQVLGCSGVARIDFMIDEETGKLYLNELNTIPGSLAFYLFEPLGIPYKKLIDRIVDLAMKRTREDEALTFSFDTNILANASFGGVKK